MDYKIWISYHKDELVEKYGLREDEHHTLFATHHDVEGKNINSLNPAYSEMVTMYYVWKNAIKSDFVGFNHYRRQFAVDRLPNAKECQIYTTYNFGKRTVYEQYAKCHNFRDMDLMLSLLDKRHGAKNAYSKYIRESHSLIGNCCFLMRWADFNKLCKFLFTMLDDFSASCGISSLEGWKKKAEVDFPNRNTEYQMRTLSFLAERLIASWINKHLKPYEHRDVVIVNFNTQKLTDAAIMSLNKHTPNCSIHIFDNSDSEPFVNTFDNVDVIDNTKGQIIDFEAFINSFPNRVETTKNDFGSAKHTYTIEKCSELFPNGFLLMDSDVLISQDVSKFFNRNRVFVGEVYCNPRRKLESIPRVLPYLCWLNVPMYKSAGINYFDGNHAWKLTAGAGSLYDTGAWFYEECLVKRLPFNNILVSDYCHHLRHGSWHHKDVDEWLEVNSDLYL